MCDIYCVMHKLHWERKYCTRPFLFINVIANGMTSNGAMQPVVIGLFVSVYA
jgi:hypothetical protein